MTSVTPLNRRILQPSVVATPAWRGSADLRVDGNCVNVTIDLPSHALNELRWKVTSTALVIRSQKPSAKLHLFIPLERAVRAGVYIVRATGGVYDVRMELK